MHGIKCVVTAHAEARSVTTNAVLGNNRGHLQEPGPTYLLDFGSELRAGQLKARSSWG